MATVEPYDDKGGELEANSPLLDDCMQHIKEISSEIQDSADEESVDNNESINNPEILSIEADHCANKITSHYYKDKLQVKSEDTDSNLIIYELQSSNIQRNSEKQLTVETIAVNKCEICKRTFLCVDDFNKHIWSHTGMDSSNDNDDETQSVNSDDLHLPEANINKSETSDDNLVVDESCSKLELNDFDCGNSKVGKFCCDICDITFSRKHYYTQHTWTHTGEKPYKCKVCGRLFRQQGVLTRHLRTHTGEKPYVCELCGKTFSLKQNLKSHKRTHADIKIKNHIAENINRERILQSDELIQNIDKNTDQISNINRERILQSDESTQNIDKNTDQIPNNTKRFQCMECGKLFRQKGVLTRHCRIHTGERPFSCDVCGIAFTVKHNLDKHKQTHAHARIVNTLCENQSQSMPKLDLKLELDVQSSCCSDDMLNEKIYKCTYCGRTFKQKGVLTRHIRTHTGEKPFDCSVCGKSFSLKHNLNSHRRTHLASTIVNIPFKKCIQQVEGAY